MPSQSPRLVTHRPRSSLRIPFLVALLTTSVLAILVVSPATAGPTDCAVPTVDDRCESWSLAAGAFTTSPDGRTVYTATANRIVAIDVVTGATLWGVVYDEDGEAYSSVSLLVSPDGSRVFLSGRSQSDWMFVAIDVATRAILWTWAGLPASRVLSEDGSTLFGLAYREYPGPLTVVAIDTLDGTTEWETTADVAGLVYPYDLLASPTGDHVFIVGSVETSQDLRPLIVAFDTSDSPTTGDQVWSATYDGPEAGGNGFFSAAVSPDGKMLFATGNQTAGALTVAYDAADGAQRWVSREGSTGLAIAVAPAGDRVFVGGADSGAVATDDDMLVLCLNPASGEILWSATHGTVATGEGALTLGEAVFDLTVSANGKRVYATGVSRVISTPVAGQEDLVTLGMSASTGDALWAARYRDPVTNGPFGASGDEVVAAAGKVLVGIQGSLLAYDV